MSNGHMAACDEGTVLAFLQGKETAKAATADQYLTWVLDELEKTGLDSQDAGPDETSPLRRERLARLAKVLFRWIDRTETWREILESRAIDEDQGEGDEEVDGQMPGAVAISRRPLSTPRHLQGMTQVDFMRSDPLDLALDLATRMPETKEVLAIVLKREVATRAMLQKTLSAIPSVCDPALYDEWWPGQSEVPLSYQPWRSPEKRHWTERQEAAESTAQDDLVQWYRTRAQEVEEEASWAFALSILTIGTRKGLDLGRELGLLKLLSKLKQSSADWRGLDMRGQLEMVVNNCAAEETAERLQDLAAIVVVKQELLIDVLSTLELEKLTSVFEESRPTSDLQTRIIKDDQELSRLSLVACYSHLGVEEWSLMTRIFECLPAFGVESLPTRLPKTADRTIWQLAVKELSLEGLSFALDQLDVHLDAAESFSRWSEDSVPLIWCLQAEDDPQAQRDLIGRLVQSSSIDKGDTESWLECLEELVRLQTNRGEGLKGVLSACTIEEVQTLFLGGLLKRGDFVASKQIMSSSRITLDPKQKENLVIEASHAFFDSASGSNMRNLDIKQAYDCLAVVPLSAKLSQERQFIEASSRLTSFKLESRPGVPITPREIRASTDRFQFIARILATNQNAHLHGQVFLSLLEQLGHKGDKLAEARLYAALVDSALSEPDYMSAATSCEKLLDVLGQLERRRDVFLPDCKEMAWQKCYQLGQQENWHDRQKRAVFLSRAITLAPKTDLPEMMKRWIRLEMEMSDTNEAGQSDAPRTSWRGQAAVAAELPGHAPMNGKSSFDRHREESRERKRDMLGKLVKTRLTSGVGWLIGAEQS